MTYFRTLISVVVTDAGSNVSIQWRALELSQLSNSGWVHASRRKETETKSKTHKKQTERNERTVSITHRSNTRAYMSWLKNPCCKTSHLSKIQVRNHNHTKGSCKHGENALNRHRHRHTDTHRDTHTDTHNDNQETLDVEVVKSNMGTTAPSLTPPLPPPPPQHTYNDTE